MIDFKFDGKKDGLQRMILAGETPEILSELMIEVSIVYGAIASRSKKDGKIFKDLFIKSVTDDEFSKHIFNEELIDAIKKDSKKDAGDKKRERRSVEDILEELIDALEEGDDDGDEGE